VSPAPLYLIDASIYIFQAYFSPYNTQSNQEGDDLSAFAGFVQFLLTLQRRERPLAGAVAMDNALFTGFRHALSADYKSNRELPDENLALQLGLCADAAAALGWPVFASELYEADDIIGTLANQARTADADGRMGSLCIVSRDKDLAQLIRTDDDVMWDFSGNRRRVRRQIEAELGLPTRSIPDYLGLVGDAVDCIAGVPGVGPVKARGLLAHFGTLEALFENLHEVPGLPLRGASKLAATLAAQEEQALLCKRLATIVQSPEACSEPFSVARSPDLLLRRVDPGEFARVLTESGLANAPRYQRLCEELLNAFDDESASNRSAAS
jgi:DNA polymerase-1